VGNWALLMSAHESGKQVLTLVDNSGTGFAGQSHCPKARYKRGNFYPHIDLDSVGS